MEYSNKLKELFENGQDFLNCEYPIICGAMTWVSEANLVAAVCNNGAFASLAAGNAPPEILREQIEKTRSLTDKKFGVNLITIAPLYEKHLEIVTEMGVEYIIFAGSFPRRPELEKAKKTGAKVMCFASTVSIAERMIRYGADAIILEGSEAGGHIGHVSAIVLLQQILFKIADKIPVFVAGGIGSGKMLAYTLLMGASGVQMGTRFVMTEECRAHENFKKQFVKAKARDAMATPQYDSKLPVVAVRSLRNRGLESFGKLQLDLLKKLEEGTIHREDAQEEVEKFWMGALRKAVVDGDIDSGSLMAGQSVGLVENEISIKELMEEILTEASAELDIVKNKLK